MKKRISIFGIIFLIMIISITTPVYAKTTCADIENEIKKYDTIKTDLKALDCSKDTDSSVVTKCNTANVNKSSQISKLYKLKEKYEDSCPTQSDKIDKIITENENECGLVLNGLLEKFTDTYFVIFYILGPILLILFASIDYTKAVVSSDASVMKKTNQRFAKRLGALILLFLSPAIINIIVSLNVSDYNLAGDAYTCNTKYINLKRTFTIEQKEVAATNNGGYTGSYNGGYTGGGGGGAVYTDSPTLKTNSTLDPNNNNGLFTIRTTRIKQGDTDLPHGSFQCVWYAKARAIEILSEVKMDENERKKKISMIRPAGGDGVAWYDLAVKGASANEAYGIDKLVGFQYSNDVTKPRVGAMISWGWTPKQKSHKGTSGLGGGRYGHVGIVEDIKDNKVCISEGGHGGGTWSTYSFNYHCLTYDQMRTRSDWYKAGDRYYFNGYVYLLDPFKE